MGEKRVFEQIDLESDPPQWRMVSGRNQEVCPWSDLIYYNPARISGTSARDSSAVSSGPVAMGSLHETGEVTSDEVPAGLPTVAGDLPNPAASEGGSAAVLPPAPEPTMPPTPGQGDQDKDGVNDDDQEEEDPPKDLAKKAEEAHKDEEKLLDQLRDFDLFQHLVQSGKEASAFYKEIKEVMNEIKVLMEQPDNPSLVAQLSDQLKALGNLIDSTAAFTHRNLTSIGELHKTMADISWQLNANNIDRRCLPKNQQHNRAWFNESLRETLLCLKLQGGEQLESLRGSNQIKSQMGPLLENLVKTNEGILAVLTDINARAKNREEIEVEQLRLKHEAQKKKDADTEAKKMEAEAEASRKRKELEEARELAEIAAKKARFLEEQIGAATPKASPPGPPTGPPPVPPPVPGTQLQCWVREWASFHQRWLLHVLD